MRGRKGPYLLMLIGLATCFSSCSHSPSPGGSFANGPISNGPASHANIHMMDQQPSDEGSFLAQPVSGNPSEGPNNNIPIPASIDLNAPSNDNGVGKFTVVKLTALNNVMANKGEQLFQVNCAACHAITADRVIGPGLKGVTGLRTPQWIMNMITNPSGMTASDPLAKALLQMYAVQMAESVTNAQAREILEYLRANDAAK
ncbi:MAG TPA: c-type cytochrome [Chitinophagaceae bacterium]|nr:c-type cytochrome [Chitinophagaceae bacterium]